MIRNVKIWEEWERDYVASTPVDFRQNLALADAILAHAIKLGRHTRTNPLEGIEEKIALARVLHCSPNSQKPSPGR